MTDNQAERVRGLDSLRFFLAVIVMLSHVENPFVPYFKSSTHLVVKFVGMFLNHAICGTAAVISFFVISGFVIHYPYTGKKNIPVKEFLVRRWVRIGIPLVVIAMIAYYNGVLKIMPIWSIFCELIYYTLYPLLFRLRISWKLKLYLSFILSVVVMIIFNRYNISSLLHQRNINFHGTYACNGPYITWMIGLPCWGLGVVLAEKIKNSTKRVTIKTIYVWRIMIFLSGVVFLFLKAHYFMSYVISLNIFALIAYKWIEQEVIYYKEHKPVAVFEYMGLFSYSLFICHKLIFILLSGYVTLNNSTYFMYIFGALVLSYLFYLLIEAPAHKLARYLGKLRNY